LDVLDELKRIQGHGSLNLRTQQALYRYKAEYRLGRTTIDPSLLTALGQQPNSVFLGEAELTSAAMAWRLRRRDAALSHTRVARQLLENKSPELYKLAAALAQHLGERSQESFILRSDVPLVQLQLSALVGEQQMPSTVLALSPGALETVHEILSPMECKAMTEQESNNGHQATRSASGRTQVSEGAWEVYGWNGAATMPTGLSPIGWVFSVKPEPGKPWIREQFRFLSEETWPLSYDNVLLKRKWQDVDLPDVPPGTPHTYQTFKAAWDALPWEIFWWSNLPGKLKQGVDTNDPTDPA
jgi:hypothetical protein